MDLSATTYHILAWQNNLNCKTLEIKKNLYLENHWKFADY